MLTCEHLGRSHEKRLPARIGGSGKREGRDDGLARSHVAQYQMVRHMG